MKLKYVTLYFVLCWFFCGCAMKADYQSEPQYYEQNHNDYGAYYEEDMDNEFVD